MSVTLVANDDTRVELSLPAAKLCAFITSILPSDGTAPSDPIPVPGLNGEVLGWAKEFLEKRAAVPMYPGAKTKRPLMDKKSLEKNGVAADYVTWIYAKPLLKVFDILLGAEFLGNEDLMDLASMRIAMKYLGWDQTQRNVVFEVPADFSPEQEEELKKEYAWAMDEPELIPEILAQQEAAAAAVASSTL